MDRPTPEPTTAPNETLTGSLTAVARAVLDRLAEAGIDGRVVPVGSAPDGWWVVPVATAAGSVVVLAVPTAPGDPAGRLLLDACAALLATASERDVALDELARLAAHDALTGLPGRPIVVERIRLAAEAASPEHPFAVLVIDVDSFRAVNEAYGHDAGDAVLEQIAHRLQELVRPGDTLGRLSGDEFVVLAEQLQDEAEAEHLGRDLALALEAAFFVGDEALRLTSSVGVALADNGGVAPDQMITTANVAVRLAKQRGRGRVEIGRADPQRLARRSRLGQELLVALEEAQLVVHYQPVVDLDTEGLIGFEALVRWAHPDRGLILPGGFIDVAEETGLVIEIGAYVLARALDQLFDWQWRLSRPDLQMNVNLTGLQLARADVLATVEAALAANPVPPSCLTLEITESTLLTDTEKCIAVLEGLRKRGVRIAIDDFGTGYSSLGYLSQLPVDTVKIDRTFVRGLSRETHATTVVAMVLSLAEALGLKVVAEGIEHEDQMASLAAMGCRYGQGYLFSRPVPPADIPAMVAYGPSWWRTPTAQADRAALERLDLLGTGH